MTLRKIHRTIPLIIAITLAFLTMPVSAQAQKAATNFFRGIVTDAETGRPVEMADLRAGRMNRETCDELTRRMEAEFAQLSGGKSLPPAEA